MHYAIYSMHRGTAAVAGLDGPSAVYHVVLSVSLIAGAYFG